MDLFKELIASVTPELKKLGFNKKGNNFYIEDRKDFGIINFQKSRESTYVLVKFTINFGIYSDVLGKLEYDYNNSVKPEIEQCHWRSRIGAFIEGNPDYWWELYALDGMSNVSSNVLQKIQKIILPEINKRLSEDGLIKSWLNDSFAGTTEIGRFKYLTTLLKLKGDTNTLNDVVDQFMAISKGKPTQSLAKEHLNSIKYFIL